MGGETVRILLIEDNPGDARLIQELLRDVNGFSFHFTLADRLSSGLAKLSEGGFTIVILDLSLPDSTGYETFYQVSSHFPKLPIVLLTGLDDEDLAERAVREGAQDYLLKGELDGNLFSRAIRYAIERKRAEEALRESQERYMLATQGANDGLWDWDLRKDTLHFSPRWKAMLGYQDHELSSCPDEWLSRIHPQDLEMVKIAIAAHLKGANPHFETEYRIQHKDGSYRWMLARGLAVRDEQGVAYRMAGSQTDITSRKKVEEQLIYDAFHDNLTGLPNRALFIDRLDRTIEHAKRRSNYLYAVLFLDLDRFKVINDSLGHAAGDQLIIQIAHALQACLRSGDSVARLGGDEFVILLEDIKDEQDAILIAHRIQEKLGQSFEVNVRAEFRSAKIYTSASIGIVLGSDEYKTSEDILRDADIAMYQAKILGKDRYVVFHKDMREQAFARLELESELRQAFERRELYLEYQPIISLKDEGLVGFEALLRWRHPQKGLIPPKVFIPVAEETGLIYSIGEWVLREACRQIRAWQKEFPLEPPLSINVNISCKQLERPELVDLILEVLHETSLEPACLHLELTENMLLKESPAIIKLLDRLNQIGVMIYIDDFGTGYSSFSYLQRYPINTLKIDRTFVNHIGVNGDNVEIVKTILLLARELRMGAVAEGVETINQLDQLRAMDCGFAQGFLFSKPVGPQQARQMMKMQSETLTPAHYTHVPLLPANPD